MSKQITIPESTYQTLLISHIKLQHLEAAGVDNWDGWEWAMESLHQDPEFIEVALEIQKNRVESL